MLLCKTNFWKFTPEAASVAAASVGAANVVEPHRVVRTGAVRVETLTDGKKRWLMIQIYLMTENT